MPHSAFLFLNPGAAAQGGTTADGVGVRVAADSIPWASEELKIVKSSLAEEAARALDHGCHYRHWQRNRIAKLVVGSNGREGLLKMALPCLFYCF